MASDDKKSKPTAAPKSGTVTAKPKEAARSETPAKSDVLAKGETPAKSETSAEPAKTESAATSADKPKSYSRGEGQKPVSDAYRENWNAIFGKKKKH